jgi:hypothetical protein
MSSASQRHKLATRGYDSLGNVKGILRCFDNWGTDSDFAKVVVEGRWDGGTTGTVVTNIGASDVTSNYTPGGAEDAVAAAAGLAAVINGQTDHTATSVENVVLITKTTAGTVEVVSSSIA